MESTVKRRPAQRGRDLGIESCSGRAIRRRQHQQAGPLPAHHPFNLCFWHQRAAVPSFLTAKDCSWRITPTLLRATSSLLYHRRAAHATLNRYGNPWSPARICFHRHRAGPHGLDLPMAPPDISGSMWRFLSSLSWRACSTQPSSGTTATRGLPTAEEISTCRTSYRWSSRWITNFADRSPSTFGSETYADRDSAGGFFPARGSPLGGRAIPHR